MSIAFAGKKLDAQFAEFEQQPIGCFHPFRGCDGNGCKSRGREKGWWIKEMRYPMRQAGRPRRCGRLLGRRKEGRKRGGGERGICFWPREIRSSGIMEFLSPLEARYWRGKSWSPIDGLKNKTRSTSERWISINVDPPCAFLLTSGSTAAAASSSHSVN